MPFRPKAGTTGMSRSTWVLSVQGIGVHKVGVICKYVHFLSYSQKIEAIYRLHNRKYSLLWDVPIDI